MERSFKIQGFTLVELSIVLVIIGLIVGGVLTGRELIRGAGVRSTIQQMEKYTTATYTFRNKYNGLPGDLALKQATAFSFYTTGMDGTTGKRDGSGVIESWRNYSIYGLANSGPVGEPLAFWRDLTDAGMIDGAYGASLASTGVVSPASITADKAGQWLPPARMGSGNYLVVYGSHGQNYFHLTAFNPAFPALDNTGGYADTVGVTPSNARDIDVKLDDGLPISGRVQAASAWGPPIDSGAYPSVGCILAGPPVTYDIGSTNGELQKCELSVMMR